MAKPFANSGDPDLERHFAASDLVLHCLPIALFGVSRIRWVKSNSKKRIKITACPDVETENLPDIR